MRALTRLTQQLSQHDWAAELALRLTPVERTLLIRSRGRRSITGALGVPLLLLGVRGARSGLHRTVPLIHTEDEDGHLVLGSHGGRPKHPQWSYDLLCEPRATVTVDGTTTPVHASLLTGRERDERWPLVLDTWPPYEAYTRRSGRELRMFLLRPAPHR